MSAKIPVVVLAIIHDEYGLKTTSQLLEEKREGALTEYLLYYHTKQSPFSLLNKWRRLQQYLVNGLKMAEQLSESHGRPQLIHVHVVLYAGLLAQRLSKKWNLPFFITEHWTAYLPEASPNFRSLNPFIRWQWNKVMRQANAISAVSQVLARRLSELSGRQVVRIPNVVDTSIFNPTKKKVPSKNLIHISTLNSQKQPHIIIKAFAEALSQVPDATLTIVGPQVHALMALASDILPPESVRWLPEMPQPELFEWVVSSAGLVLYSHYETFGCVVIEAHACGVPVIASDIPVMREIVTENNGLLVKQSDTRALANAMITLLTKQALYDGMQIAINTQAQFGYPTVAGLFMSFYTIQPGD